MEKRISFTELDINRFGFSEVSFDAVLRETTNQEFTITDNPIESGALTQDHIVRNPKTWVLNVGVSNTPIFKSLLSVITGGFFDDEDLFESGSGLEQSTRASTAWDILQNIAGAGSRFTLNTGLETVKNVAISGLGISQDVDTEGVALPTIKLKEIIVTRTQVSKLPEDTLKGEDTKLQATSQTNRGKVQKAEAPANSSILYDLIIK